MEYDNTNKGAIWPNDRMREGKQDPQYTGSVNVDGVEYWVSAWRPKKDAKKGAPSLNFSLNKKEANKAPRNEPPQDYPPQNNYDDDPPF